MSDDLAKEIAKGALRIDWKDTESAARRVAEYAADRIEELSNCVAVLEAENARLRDGHNEIIEREDKAWMPMRAFRSDEEVALDEAKHEAWMDAATIARAALAELKGEDRG